MRNRRTAVLLAQRGYLVTEIDRSDRMLAIAKEKARRMHVEVEFQKRNTYTVRLERRFDTAIATFATMGYQTTNERLLNIWHPLNRDGLSFLTRNLAGGGRAKAIRQGAIVGEGARTITRSHNTLLIERSFLEESLRHIKN